MVSFDAYASLMDWENPGQPNMIVDKIFLKLNNSDEATIKEVTREINFRLEGKYDYLIDDAISLIKIVFRYFFTSCLSSSELATAQILGFI